MLWRMAYRLPLSASRGFNEKGLFSHAERSTIQISCRDAEQLALHCQNELSKELYIMSIKSAPRLLSLLVALSSALVAAVPVRADQLPDHHGRVTVENVWIPPANEAGQAILRLRILHETRSPMHPLGGEIGRASCRERVGKYG